MQEKFRGGIWTPNLEAIAATINSLNFGAGKRFYVDPVNGSDSASGLSPKKALASLPEAHDRCVAGRNDVVNLIGNGAASGSARLSELMTWSKNATHLFGVGAPTMVAQRARIAPTAAIAAFAQFIKVTAAGCIFHNFSTFHGFDTGGANQIAWIDEGQRNYYSHVHLGGMGDQESADDAGSRSLKIGSGGNGEHTFWRCTVGLDTVTRGAANASIEFAGATPRNSFLECILPFHCDAAAPIGIKAAAAASMDRWQLFQRCMFINAVGSGTTTMAALATLAASTGGFILIDECTRVGITDLGTDANSLGQIFVNGPAGAPVGDDTGKAVVAIAT